jgi:hypothetical protein
LVPTVCARDVVADTTVTLPINTAISVRRIESWIEEIIASLLGGLSILLPYVLFDAVCGARLQNGMVEIVRRVGMTKRGWTVRASDSLLG